MDLMSLVARLSLDSSDYENGIEKAKSAGDKLSAGAVAMGNLISSGISAVGNKVGEFSGYVMQSGMSFEATMSKVGAISGATGEDMQSLSDKAQEMGAKTKFSATEAGEAFTYMAMAGWKTGDMMSGIEGIMNLAAASGEDLALTSDIVTDALTAFGLSASDSGHFADILAAASSNANTNVAMMGETFKYVAPVAGALGVNAEDTAEAIGLMANAGIKSSQAGTSMRSILTRLSTDAGASKKSLGALGTLTKELGVKFYDSQGKVRDFSDILDDSRKAWSKLSAEDAANFAKKIAGQEGISAWLAMMNAEEKDIQKLRTSIKECDGTAAEMADTMNNNLNGALTILGSNVESLSLAFYEGIKGTAKTAVEGLTTAVEKMTGKVKKWMASDATQKKLEKISQAITNIVSKIADNLDPVLDGIIGIVDGLVSAIGFLVDNFDSIVAVVGTVIGVFGTLKAVTTALDFAKLLTSPIGLAVLAITGLVLALKDCGVTFEDVKNIIATAAQWIQEKWQPIGAFFEDLFGRIQNAFAPLKLFLSHLFGGDFKTAEQAMLALQYAVEEVWKRVSGYFEQYKQAAIQWFQGIDWDTIIATVSGWATKAWEFITGVLSTAATYIYDWFTNINWDDVIQAVAGWASGVIEFLGGILGTVGQTIADWLGDVPWDDVIQAVAGWAAGAIEFLFGVLGTVGATIAGWLEDVPWDEVIEAVSGWASGAFEAIKGLLGTAGASIAEWFGDINWDEVIQSVAGWASGAIDFLFGVLGTVGATIAGWLEDVPWEEVISAVSGWADGAFQAVKGWLGDTGKSIQGWFESGKWETVKSTVSGWAEGALKKVKGWLGEAGKSIAKWYTDTDWDEVKNKVADWSEGALTKVQGWLGNAASTIAGWFKGEPKNWEDVKSTVSGWAQGAWTIIDAVFGGAAEGIANWIKGNEDVWEGVKSKVSGWAQDAWSKIEGFFQGSASTIANLLKGDSSTWESVKSSVSSWAEGAWSNIKKAFSGATSYFKKLFSGIGKKSAEGYAEGITEGSAASDSASAGMVNSSATTAKNTAQIKSPSRLFRNEVGRMVGEGYALGIEDSMPHVEDALAEMMGVPEMNTIGGEVSATGSSAGMSDANLERLANAIVTAIDRSGMNQASIELDGRVLGRYMRDGMGVEFV